MVCFSSVDDHYDQERSWFEHGRRCKLEHCCSYRNFDCTLRRRTAMRPVRTSIHIHRRSALWLNSNSVGWRCVQCPRIDRASILCWYPGRHFRALSGLVHWLLRQERGWLIQCLDWRLGQFWRRYHLFCYVSSTLEFVEQSHR